MYPLRHQIKYNDIHQFYFNNDIRSNKQTVKPLAGKHLIAKGKESKFSNENK